jgi:outer membrane protein assembly factor BamB
MFSQSKTLFISLIAGIVCCLAGISTAAEIQPFSFVQLSDSHFSPVLARLNRPVALRGADSIRWINQQASGSQHPDGWSAPAPAPAFGLMTGDIFEYGVIDQTWQQFEQAFNLLPYPIHIIPGNHDNTWVAMYRIMRQRHGGENFTFEHGGIKFLNLCSASPQEPVPTLDGKTRAWLDQQLQQTPPDQPLIISLHHPLHDKTFAPAEYPTLIDRLRSHNVLFILYGHGHALRLNDHDGLTGIMGGSTYGKYAGYAVYDFAPGQARVAYHYFRDPSVKDEAQRQPTWKSLTEKPIPEAAPQRLFAIQAPAEGALVGGDTLRVSLDGEAQNLESTQWSFQIDGADVEATPVPDAGGLAFEVPLGNPVPGWRRLTARLNSEEGQRDLRTVAFHQGANVAPWSWRRSFPAAFKAAPTLMGDAVLLLGTDGWLRCLDRIDGSTRWSFATEGELLAPPALTDHLIIFGSGDGSLYALDHAGKLIWKVDLGVAIYGWPVIDGDVVYIGDNLGRVHARRIADGSERWTFARADYAIESAVCVWNDLVVAGAWDGYLYALNRQTGELAWKALGPKSSAGRGIRYYAPADCGPVAIGDQLFVTDRGYLLAAYDQGGTMNDPLDLNITAIALDNAGQGLYARAIDDRVLRFDVAGQKVWETSTPAGRFPIPPTVTQHGVFICSNSGLLQRLDVETGDVKWQYQVTPGFYIMAPVSVDSEGVAYVTSMNGTVTAIPTMTPSESLAAAPE